MKQILQNLENGNTELIDSPKPNCGENQLLINSSVSLVSAGTERMLVDFAKASLLDKARKQPEKVKQVIDKIRTDGLITTVDAVTAKLKQPLPLGYSNVGIVDEVGKKVQGFSVGDRVISNGNHSEVVNVSKNLCAKIPNSVSDETAAFTILASIGLQGVRLVSPSIGENIAVIGSGLIGLLTIQILKANGCNVLAVDYDKERLCIAKEFGAVLCDLSSDEDPVSTGMKFSNGNGVDAVLITASTNASEPITYAARMSRKRGRIILVGVSGLELNRADFYEKELSFQVSCSYGPGRYDKEYEESGNDYPYGFVRWTEQRNFEAILDLMAQGLIRVDKLITHQFLIENAGEAYRCLIEDKSALGILLKYKSDFKDRVDKSIQLSEKPSKTNDCVNVLFIGAGNYASRILIPSFKKASANLVSISSNNGLSGAIHGKKNGFGRVSTDIINEIKAKDTNCIVIATRHDSHADLVFKALDSGKHVFVEKPLAITLEELSRIENKYNESRSVIFMVGFNRRFSPLVVKMKKMLETLKQPKSITMTINAGYIPDDHWTQDPSVGGGRIIGEACHFIDLMRFLTDSPISFVQAKGMGKNPCMKILNDKASITLGFSDGSFGTINYFANGAPSFPKERIEVFCSGKILQIDNFRKLNVYGWKTFRGSKLLKQDKGQTECVKQFVESIKNNGYSPIPVEQLFEVTRATIEAEKLLSAL